MRVNKTSALLTTIVLAFFLTCGRPSWSQSDDTPGFRIRKPICQLDDSCQTSHAGTTPEAPENPGETVDTTPPQLVSTTPPDDATDVWVTANPLMVFNEPMQKGTGHITIHDTTNGVVFETIDAAGSAVSVSGNNVSLLLSTDLSTDTQYNITVDAGAMADIAGNPFAGLSTPTDWNFATQATATAQVFASFPTNGARDTEAFAVDGTTYIAATNFYNGSSFNLNSKIYRFTPDGATPDTRVTEVASVATNGVLDWESFKIGGQTYLAFANYYNGSSYDILSRIYSFNPGNATPLIEVANILTHGAAAWEAFEVDGQTYLALANYLSTSGGYNQISKIYRFTPGDATPLVEVASVATNGANDWDAFTIDGQTYLALATLYSNARIFSFTPGNATPLVEVATVPTNGAFKWTTFNMDGTTYLAVANSNSGATSYVYRFDPTDATPMLEVASVAISALNWDVFTMGGTTYLTLATNSNPTSNVYIFDPAQPIPADRLVEKASFPTMTAMSADIFTNAGQTYVSFANYMSGSLNVDSWIYRFYP